MKEEYSIYCDESCHLEHDGQPVMVLGAVWCSTSKRREIAERIKSIKDKYNITNNAEMKWTKVSNNKLDAYLDLVDYFFDDDDLHFRAIIIPNKQQLNHKVFRQTHNQWHYKMYFDLLKSILSNNAKYNVFVDIKDSIGGEKIKKLQDCLQNNMYDFDRSVIKNMQLVRSEEIGIMQLVDILIGAVMSENRQKTQSTIETSSIAKKKIVEKIKNRSGYGLVRTTLISEKKFNLFVWSGKR